MNGKAQGLSLIELFMVITIISILILVGLVGVQRARNRAYDAITQAYLREVALGVEISRTGNDFVLPAVQSCASLAGKPTDPEGVRSCIYTPGKRDGYTVTVESSNGATFSYNGAEIEELP